MKKLEDYGYKVSDVSSNYIGFCRVVDKGYEKHYIEINFEMNTIKFTEVYYNNGPVKLFSQDTPLDIIELAIDILKKRKVVIDYGEN